MLIGAAISAPLRATATCETSLNRELSTLLRLPDRELVSQLHRLDPDRQSITIRLARVWRHLGERTLHERFVIESQNCIAMQSELVITLERWFAQRLERLLVREMLDAFAFEWSVLAIEGGTPAPLPAALRLLQTRYLQAVRNQLFTHLREYEWGLPWRNYSELNVTLVATHPNWANGFHASTCAISNWRTGETYFRSVGAHLATDLEVCWFHELSHHAYARSNPMAGPVEQETYAWTQTLAFLERFSLSVPIESWSVELRLLYLRLRAEGPAHFSESVLPHLTAGALNHK